MKHKHRIKKAIAGVCACAVIGINALPAAQQFSALSPFTVTASALEETSSYTLDPVTGELKLRGRVKKAEISALKLKPTLKIIKITCASGTVLPPDCSYLFSGFKDVVSIDLSVANSSNITNMEKMFNDCSNLTNLNLTNFDTRQCTNMSGMFSGCYRLPELNLTFFHTSKVKNMGYMFKDCRKLA